MSKLVKSETIYSPQNFVDAVTGKCYIIDSDDDVKEIEKLLKINGFEGWNYPLSEIDHIVENELNVVLVECMVYNKKKREFEHEYRWFEVPDDFKEE